LTAKPSWYRATLLLALAAAIAQVALGGVVRVTGSGDACPDWPLCHGQIIPPHDLNIWLEFSHRLSASALGVLVLIATWLAWRRAPKAHISLLAIAAALVLVVAAALLGGLTVLTELAWWARLIHLVLAELVVACIAVASLTGPPDERSTTDPRAGSGLDRKVGLMCLAALLGVIVFGSYMVGFNYGAACTSWPMCQGTRIPEGLAYLVNMGHRVTTALIALPVFWLCYRAWHVKPASQRVRWIAALTAACMVAAIALGALMVWLNFSVLLRSLHLAIATLVWVSNVALVAAMFDPSRFRMRLFSQ
jgi:heme A synthase